MQVEHENEQVYPWFGSVARHFLPIKGGMHDQNEDGFSRNQGCPGCPQQFEKVGEGVQHEKNGETLFLISHAPKSNHKLSPTRNGTPY